MRGVSKSIAGAVPVRWLGLKVSTDAKCVLGAQLLRVLRASTCAWCGKADGHWMALDGPAPLIERICFVDP